MVIFPTSQLLLTILTTGKAHSKKSLENGWVLLVSRNTYQWHIWQIAHSLPKDTLRWPISKKHVLRFQKIFIFQTLWKFESPVKVQISCTEIWCFNFLLNVALYFMEIACPIKSHFVICFEFLLPWKYISWVIYFSDFMDIPWPFKSTLVLFQIFHGSHQFKFHGNYISLR